MNSQDMETEDCDLLARCYAGDESACTLLVERRCDSVRWYARQKMGVKARNLLDSGDLAHEVLTELLCKGPRFTPKDDRHLHALLLHMARNRILEAARYGRAECRDLGRLRALQSGETSMLGLREGSSAAPPRLLEKKEEAALVQVSLQMLDPEDREIIWMRRFEECSFKEIAKRFAIEPPSAERRFRVAVARLGSRMRSLQEDGARELEAELESDD